MTTKQIRKIEEALRLADAALWEISQEAGDIPYWNRGGLGYRAQGKVYAALEIIKSAGELKAARP